MELKMKLEGCVEMLKTADDLEQAAQKLREGSQYGITLEIPYHDSFDTVTGRRFTHTVKIRGAKMNFEHGYPKLISGLYNTFHDELKATATKLREYAQEALNEAIEKNKPVD